MTLREDVNRVLMDGKEHDAIDVLKQFPNNHMAMTHKDPARSIRNCFRRMERKGEVVKIEGRFPIAVRRINNGK